MRGDTLTQKQEAFCLAYIETGNASEAYRRAYPVSKKWKDQAVHVNASKMLADAKVALRVDELRASIASATVVSEVRVIEEAARIGLFDPAGLLASDGSLLPILEMAPEVRAAIASIEFIELTANDGTVTSRVKKVKIWDKNSALEKIMRHLGSFEKDNKQKNLFDGVPRETLKVIAEKLRVLSQKS